MKSEKLDFGLWLQSEYDMTEEELSKERNIVRSSIRREYSRYINNEGEYKDE